MLDKLLSAGWYDLKKRGYNNASINHCFNKASGIDRKDLTQNKEKNTNNRVPFVITYHPALRNLSNIVQEHWTTIQKHPELCKIYKEPCLAVGIAVYDEFFSFMCAAEFVCALDVFARHTSSRITFLTPPSGMIKADRKGKASGLENLRPYHRMESMRKSNILS
jgi:hypothetical protein